MLKTFHYIVDQRKAWVNNIEADYKLKDWIFKQANKQQVDNDK